MRLFLVFVLSFHYFCSNIGVEGLVVFGFGAFDASLTLFFRCGFALCFGSFGVDFLDFTFFETFGDSTAYGIEDYLDRFGGVVVGGDYEVDVRRRIRECPDG